MTTAAVSSSPTPAYTMGLYTGVEIDVVDHGTGLPDSGNLFTPFFSTKDGGSGVGLLLGRQIAEAHDGSLQVSNRDDGQAGCVARVSLPGSA